MAIWAGVGIHRFVKSKNFFFPLCAICRICRVSPRTCRHFYLSSSIYMGRFTFCIYWTTVFSSVSALSVQFGGTCVLHDYILRVAVVQHDTVSSVNIDSAHQMKGDQLHTTFSCIPATHIVLGVHVRCSLLSQQKSHSCFWHWDRRNSPPGSAVHTHQTFKWFCDDGVPIVTGYLLVPLSYWLFFHSKLNYMKLQKIALINIAALIFWWIESSVYN